MPAFIFAAPAAGRAALPPSRPRSVATACTLVLLASVSGAHADDTTDTLPRIEVTASPFGATGLGLNLPAASGSLTGVSVQDLPASLGTVSSEQMLERSDHGVNSAVTRTVGISENGSPGNGGLSFASRGFSGVNSVGVAEDGLTLGIGAGTVTYPADTWGYERVDVLRGPASLMYGSGTMGATLNAVRKTPSRIRETEVLIGAGTHGTARLGVGTTGPLGETLSYRIDAYGQRSDGERAYGNARNAKLMTGLRWQPRSNLMFDLTADIADQKPERYWGTPLVNGELRKDVASNNYNVADGDIRYKDKRVRLKGEWSPQHWIRLHNETYRFDSDRHWKNVEGYRHNPATGRIDRDSYLEIGHDTRQVGNRLGLELTPRNHQIAVGWDVSRTDFALNSNAPFRGSSSVSLLAPEHGWWSSPDATVPRFDSRVRQHAFYLEDAWNVNEQWLLMGGIRRDLYQVARTDAASGKHFESTLGGTSWRLGASYRLNERTNLYAQYSQGHDPVTSLLSLGEAQSRFRLSKGRQVEIGVKQQLADDRGEWTLAAFDISKKDILTRDPDRPAISVQGGQQSSRGVELSAAIRPTKAWRLEGNVAWVAARFDHLREGAAGIDRSGNRPANVARYTANLWAHYQQPKWKASLGLRQVGARFADNANSVKLPAYTTLDGALSWDVNRMTTLSLSGRNLTNRFYASNTYGKQWLVAPGRHVELTALMRF